MDLSTWLSRLNPNDSFFLIIFIIAVAGIGRFISQRLFPWLTDKYFPARMAFEQSKLDGENKRESERTLVLGTIRDALIELRTISQQLMNLMRDHDTWNRDLAQRTYPHAVDSMIAAEDADKAEIIMKVK